MHPQEFLSDYKVRDWWTISEVCDYLRCSKTSFHTKFKRHPDFPRVYNQGARTKLYRGAEVIQFAEQQAGRDV